MLHFVQHDTGVSPLIEVHGRWEPWTKCNLPERLANEEHGMRMEVESAPGRTMFRTTVPLAEREEWGARC
jgi:hypothetical protein